MRKYLSVLFCLCLFASLAAPVRASEAEPDLIAEYEALYGEAPVATDFPDPAEYQAAYDIWFAGLVPYIDMRSAELSRQKEEAEEAARKAAEADPSPKTVEGAGSNDDISSNFSDTSLVSVLSDKYPVGSYVSSAGNVYSPDGELLSPGTTLAMEADNALAPGAVEVGSLSSGEPSDQNGASPVSDADTLAVIAGLVSDIATDPPVSTIEDLRSTDPPAEILTGLKALVTSIFGEYTPVTTTSVVSQTVGNDTHQYLVETVAPGAAGVDYEWIAGVLLFAIMLFCLMKLVGGVLK